MFIDVEALHIINVFEIFKLNIILRVSPNDIIFIKAIVSRAGHDIESRGIKIVWADSIHITKSSNAF